jgi:hypothetical protein
MASKTTDTNLGETLVSTLEGTFDDFTVVEKKSYRRMTAGGKTLGYLYLGARVPAVEVSDGKGKYTYLSVRTKADVKKVVSALKAVAKRSTKKS